MHSILGNRQLIRALSTTSLVGLLTATCAGMLFVGALELSSKGAVALALVGLGALLIAVVATLSTIRRWAHVVEGIREKALLLTDATKDGVWLYNPATGETFFSSHFRSQLGVTGRADMDVILGLFGHVDPEDAERAWKHWGALLADRTPFSIDVRLLIDGSARWYRWSGRASSGPEPIYSGALRNVHQLREAEEQVNDIALLAVESPNPVFRLDSEGVILIANKAAAPLLESWKTAPGRSLPPRILQILLPHFEAHQQAELEFACGDRQYSALFVPHVGRGYINVYCMDVTERAQLNLAVEESRKKLHEAHERMRFMAQHDHLTRLPNRALFEDRLAVALEHTKRQGTTIALMMIDLDRFKEINDSFGHDAGDAVLTGVADRLSGSVRGSDTVARLGGDEFAIILGDLHEDANALVIAAKILSSMADPVRHQGTPISLSLSIGIAFCRGDATPLSIKDLTKHADIAVYHAKNEGRGCFRVYDETQQEIPAVG